MEVETHDGTRLVASRMIPALDESAAGIGDDNGYNVPWETMREESRREIGRRTDERIIAIAAKGAAKKSKKLKRKKGKTISTESTTKKGDRDGDSGGGKRKFGPPRPPTLMMTAGENGPTTISHGEDRPTNMASCMVAPLHPDNTCGIDTCSGMAVSTHRHDFLTLDTSQDARESVTIRGIGGSMQVGGRGAMTVPATDAMGNKVMIIDPEGVFLVKEVDGPDFRVFSQLRLKRFHLNLVQGHTGDTDALVCQLTGRVIPLHTENAILVLRMADHSMEDDERAYATGLLQHVVGGRSSAAVEVTGEPSGSQ